VLTLLQNSSWIADGSIGARRVVYVFTDPNCPYCNKFWAEARPWVQAGKQLRHVIVGILTPESPGKAAALLSAPNPAVALAAYEGGQVEATAQALASGTPSAVEPGPAALA
jgi:thiol:disulfide interchange protein DsbG